MTALPDWMDLPNGLGAEDYEALPEEICRRIEIVDGAVIVNAAPSRRHRDQTDKPAEYAEAGIRHYWRVERDAPQDSLSVFCYRLDPTTRTYASAGVYSGKMTVTDPVSVTLDLTTLL